MYTELVHGVDLSWTAADTSTRRVDNSSNKSKKLVSIMFILAIVPLSVIVCFVLHNCVHLCSRSAKDQNDNDEETRRNTLAVNMCCLQ
jgi:heme/copper-type cytochrome/quinol oxidase subunit 2